MSTPTQVTELSSAKIPRQTGVIILAAGASSRMGTAKQLLPIDGIPMISRIISVALDSAVWPVVVVVGASAPAIRPIIARFPVLIADNPTWMEGMASSLRAGMNTLQSFSRTIDAALVALCDQPGFTRHTVERLLAAQRTSHRRIAAARYNGRLGAPALFHRSYFAKLSGLSGDEGARHVIADAATADDVEAVDFPELALDLDTPADYARLKETLRESEVRPQS